MSIDYLSRGSSNMAKSFFRFLIDILFVCMKNNKQKRSFYNHSLISLFVFILPIVLLSSFSNILNISLHNTAWAIPNKLLTNNTLSKNQSNNNITNLSSSLSSSPPHTSINHAPVANAGVNQTVNENSTVTLNGIASDPDPSDNKLSYSWKQIAGPRVKLINSNSTNPSFIAPTVTSDRDLKFSLTAKDDKGASSLPAVVTITVKHTNRPPVANAGPDQIVNPGDVVSLDGSKSKDPDGDRLIYSWTQISGPTVKLDGANTSIATFTAPSNIPADTNLIFRLTVKDSKNAAGTADVKIADKYIPAPNKPPIANAGADQTVNATDSVKLDGTKSKDPDGNISSYSWKEIAGPTITLNQFNTATPSFTAPAS